VLPEPTYEEAGRGCAKRSRKMGRRKTFHKPAKDIKINCP